MSRPLSSNYEARSHSCWVTRELDISLVSAELHNHPNARNLSVLPEVGFLNVPHQIYE